MTRPVTLTVNGRSLSVRVAPRTHLADVLREQALLTGTHLGCEHGVCGACTLMLDGRPVRGCITFAVGCDGASVRTIEGFTADPLMSALREAFTRHHALQCGYCTPGMLITAYDIVRRLPGADDARIREELAGNLCRCTGYVGIVDAIRSVLAAPPLLDVIQEPLPPAVPLGVLEPLPRASGAAAPPVTAGAVRAGAGEATRCTVRVPVEAAALWRLLRDPEQVARCLPGASLPSGADADPLVFRMEVALGPMRVGFEGTASIDYRDADRRAHVTARGEDARTRTRGEGTLVFTVREAGAGASELEVSLEYALTGPLAQFSRAPVVDALVAQLLERFAANAARLGAGQEVEEQAALSAGAFGMQALWRWIRERFGR